MNKNQLFAILLLCIVSLSEAVKKGPKYFNLFDELHGSWMVMQTTMSISTGDVIKETKQSMYNVTKNEVPSELRMYEVDLVSREEKRLPYQTIISVSSNFTASINKFQPGADIEITKLIYVNIFEFLRNEVFFASGSLVEYPKVKYEFTILPNNIIKFEVDIPEKDERILYMGKKIHVAPVQTFFTKYGSYMVIALAIVVQLIVSNMNQNPVV